MSMEEEESGDDEIWLISYSDLMTLLFGFFVLMFVFASTKTGDAQKVREGLAKSFGGTYAPPYDELAQQLAKQADALDHPIMKEIEVQIPKDGMEITFRSNLLFESGSADLREDVKKTMKMIAKLISTNVVDAEIFVSGHTDDVPIHTAKFPSNWELSTSRAGSVVREFIDSGYDPKMLVALGYAETRPAYPNRDENDLPIQENRERNRRVVIKVVVPGLVKGADSGVSPSGQALATPQVEAPQPTPSQPSADAPKAVPEESPKPLAAPSRPDLERLPVNR